MNDELKPMEHIEVWDVVDLLESSKTIGCKWIFKTIHDCNENVERHKVRFVAKDFTRKKRY